MIDFTIKPIKTKKHTIKVSDLMYKQLIPSHPLVSLFIGASGSGKSTLTASLLSRDEFYKRKNGCYFDKVILLIGSQDDMYDFLLDEKIVKREDIYLNPSSDDLEVIIQEQEENIENLGFEESPKLLIIIDDMIQNKKFMTSRQLGKLFFANRHLNTSVWLCSQYLNSVPKSARQQASHLFIFQLNRAELMILEEQYAPSDYSKMDFRRVISYALTPTEMNKKPFLHICKLVPHNQRFRRCLGEFINLSDRSEEPLVFENVPPSLREPELREDPSPRRTKKKRPSFNAASGKNNTHTKKENEKQFHSKVNRKDIIYGTDDRIINFLEKIKKGTQ